MCVRGDSVHSCDTNCSIYCIFPSDCRSWWTLRPLKYMWGISHININNSRCKIKWWHYFHWYTIDASDFSFTSQGLKDDDRHSEPGGQQCWFSGQGATHGLLRLHENSITREPSMHTAHWEVWQLHWLVKKADLFPKRKVSHFQLNWKGDLMI